MLKLKRMMSCSASFTFSLFAQAANFGSVYVDQSKRYPTHVPAAVVWISACDDRLSFEVGVQSFAERQALASAAAVSVLCRWPAGASWTERDWRE